MPRYESVVSPCLCEVRHSGKGQTSCRIPKTHSVPQDLVFLYRPGSALSSLCFYPQRMQEKEHIKAPVKEQISYDRQSPLRLPEKKYGSPPLPENESDTSSVKDCFRLYPPQKKRDREQVQPLLSASPEYPLRNAQVPRP